MNNSQERMGLGEVLDLLKEVALTPAWQHFWERLEVLQAQALEELEASETWEQFLETRGGLRALRKISEWRAEMMEDVREARKMADDNGEGVDHGY